MSESLAFLILIFIICSGGVLATLSSFRNFRHYDNLRYRVNELEDRVEELEGKE